MSEAGNIQYKDTIQCFFFSPLNENVNWENLCHSLNETAKSLYKNYVWHRDEFKIYKPLMNSDSDMPPHLVSTTYFGGNIQDQSFVIYLVFKLTEVYPDILVQIKDNDGDFLFKEAKPFLNLSDSFTKHSTQNRTFIHKNQVHIIVPPIADLNRALLINDAIRLIMMYTEQTKAPFFVEKAIRNKMWSSYPNQYNAEVTIPVDVAALLKLRPMFTTPLIMAANFHGLKYKHDDSDAKKSDDCVNVTLNFSNLEYALIMQPNPLNKEGQGNISAVDKKKELSLKLARGFDIIMNNKGMSSPGASNAEASPYNQLLEFERLCMPRGNPFSLNSNTFYREMMSEFMCTKEYVEYRESLLQNIHNASYLRDEANDDWLNDDPGNFGDLLVKGHEMDKHFGRGELPPTLGSYQRKSSSVPPVETLKRMAYAGPMHMDFANPMFATAAKAKIHRELVAIRNQQMADPSNQAQPPINDEFNFMQLTDMVNSILEE